MSWVNEAGWDRTLRIAAGVVMLVLGWGGFVGGSLGTVLSWLGFLPLLTGIIGWCPAYSLFGVRTCRSQQTPA